MTLIKAGVIQGIGKSDSALTAHQLAETSGAETLLIGMNEALTNTVTSPLILESAPLESFNALRFVN